MRMNKENKLVPELRFPEFRDAKEWKEKKLGELTYKVGEKNKEGIKFPIYSINNKTGFVPQSEQFDGVDSNDRGYDISLYKIIERNSFAYNPARINVGSIGYSGELHNIIISSLYVCFKTEKSLNDRFLQFFIETNDFNESVKNNVEGGIRNYLFYENFSRIKIYLPDPLEQLKIAACLSSLDNLIRAQNQKLEALKDHKKGLMQQLFPAEGKTVPKLRFKEFENDGEWKEYRLSKLGQLISGLTYSPEDVRDEGLLVLRSSNVQNCKVVFDDCVYVTPDIKGANISKPNDILICVRNGSKSLIGKNALIPEGIPLCTHGAFMTVFRSKSAKFVYQLFQTDSYNKKVSADLGATINSINGGQFIKYKFYIPEPPEQQKIASCLASLDEQIDAQMLKIEALKDHKKGLMQGLFPKVNELNT